MSEKLSSDKVNDSFQFITKKISSKLLGCLEQRLNKIVPQKLVIDWQDTLLRIHAVFYSDEFLSASETDIVEAHSRDILIHNCKNNRNYW